MRTRQIDNANSSSEEVVMEPDSISEVANALDQTLHPMYKTRNSGRMNFSRELPINSNNSFKSISPDTNIHF